MAFNYVAFLHALVQRQVGMSDRVLVTQDGFLGSLQSVAVFRVDEANIARLHDGHAIPGVGVDHAAGRCLSFEQNEPGRKEIEKRRECDSDIKWEEDIFQLR